MADPSDRGEVPQAMIQMQRRHRLSIVWIIPILAALVAIGIAVQRARSEGPTITIVFSAAEGLEAGKTLIKYKDVNIGQVTSVHLTEDFGKVEVNAKITKRAAGLMVEDAKFWIVRPTISLSGVSGLNTLLSGNYIGFEAGKSKEELREFTGLDKAPFIPGQPGRRFVLKADDLGSLSAGSPIYYRRLPVGQVISYGLARDGASVEINVFVSAPYDRFVTAGTRFWKASGVDVAVGANGLEVHTESLVALLVGGLAFDTPPAMAKGPAAPENALYTLYADRATALKAPDPTARSFVLHFDESMRGLTVGAPVTFLGLPAGEVTAVALILDERHGRVRPRVTITFFPERLIQYFERSAQAPTDEELEKDTALRRAFVRKQFEERGLRAQLRSGSLLTGQLYVAFDYFPRAAKAKIDWKAATPELPVVPGTLVDLTMKLASIADKIDRMPIEAIGTTLNKDLESLDVTLAAATKMITNVDEQLVPTLKTDLEALQRVLGNVERTLDNANATMLGPNAPAQQELRDALTEFTRAARSLRVLLDYLERHPESPIRGKSDSKSGGK